MNLQCSNCGGDIAEQDGFCTNCGHPTGLNSSDPVDDAADDCDDYDEVLAILPQARYCKGFLGLASTTNILVITRHEILIIETPEALQLQINILDEELRTLRRDSSLSNHDFIRTHEFSSRPWQIYARRPLEEILQSNRHNRLLEMSMLKKVEVAVGEGWSDDRLHFYLPLETLKFVLLWPLGEIALEALRKAMSTRLIDIS